MANVKTDFVCPTEVELKQSMLDHAIAVSDPKVPAPLGQVNVELKIEALCCGVWAEVFTGTQTCTIAADGTIGIKLPWAGSARLTGPWKYHASSTRLKVNFT